MSLKLLVLISLTFIIAGLFYAFYPRIENFFVFFPETLLEFTPDELNLRYEDVYFETEDGERLHGWFFPVEEKSPVVLFCHGNAGNISHRLENIKLLVDQKLQVFIFDYRGYGRSSGSPSEKGLRLDGLAAHDYLTKRADISAAQIIPFGRSLGATVAMEISIGRKTRSMMIEGAFTSTREMARTMPLFYPISFMLPRSYDNLEKIGRVTVPKLVIHGTEDEIVPFSMGKRLFEAASPPKYFFPVDGAGHNDTFTTGAEIYAETIARFTHKSSI